ncbi:MAG: 2Fe-2S iron-sulfur cluster binding domain-containing protein, partial [Myxococcales bacterium]|nr:2Fe-2S iron-sulfur cluster binding domain-containing protein [Myxococcales bacterium]
MTLTFVLNGETRTVPTVAEGSTLLQVLREDLGEYRVISPKDGCAPQGQCGCCLVLIDGKPQVSCAMPATKAEGKHVVTLEGVPPEERKLFGEAFARVGGLQCGFCIPGFVMRAKSLLDANPEPTDDEIRKKLDVHLCRCTGYQRIVEAIQTVALVKRGGTLPPADTSGRVGTSLDRYQGEAMTLGMRPYVDDMYPQGLLHGAVRLSDHARAKVVKIDTSKAEAMPGV